jgi:hypothetical protein
MTGGFSYKPLDVNWWWRGGQKEVLNLELHPRYQYVGKPSA